MDVDRRESGGYLQKPSVDGRVFSRQQRLPQHAAGRIREKTELAYSVCQALVKAVAWETRRLWKVFRENGEKIFGEATMQKSGLVLWLY